MGKWLTRLAEMESTVGEKCAAPPVPRHCQNRQNPVLSVLAGGSEGGRADSLAKTDATPQASDPRGLNWSEADIQRFHARRTRLLRWGWSVGQAEALADRLTCRDVAGTDDRVSCADCQHLRPGHCENHRRAGLQSDEVGRSLVGLLQRCPGFQAEP